MAEDSTRSLTADQKLAIQEYLVRALGRWLKFFGFASIGSVLVALVVSMTYVFLILPGEAVDIAKVKIQQDIDAVAGDLTQKLADRLQAVGESKARLTALQRDMEKTTLGVRKIQNALSKVDESTLAASSKFVAHLKDAEQLDDLINRIAMLEERRLCYCLDARHNGESCTSNGNWTVFRGDGKTPDRIRIYYCN